jgi:hypothetical protein
MAEIKHREVERVKSGHQGRQVFKSYFDHKKLQEEQKSILNVSTSQASLQFTKTPLKKN